VKFCDQFNGSHHLKLGAKPDRVKGGFLEKFWFFGTRLNGVRGWGRKTKKVGGGGGVSSRARWCIQPGTPTLVDGEYKE